jgi:hypothetical protein
MSRVPQVEYHCSRQTERSKPLTLMTTINEHTTVSQVMARVYTHKGMTSSTSRFLHNNNKFWEELIAYFPWYDTDHIENDASNNSFIVACVFLTAVTFLTSSCLAMIQGVLPIRCLAMMRGFLPSRCLATMGAHTDTEWWEGFFN